MAVSRKKKVIVLLIILVAAGGAITASVLSNNKTIAEVQMADVKRRDLLESKVTASGEVRPVKFYNLTAEVTGRVTNIYVREGDFVKQDQPLVKVDPTQQANTAASQEALLRAEEQDARSAEIQWHAAENNVNSTKNLIIAAQAELRRAQADLQLAEAEYNRAAEMVEAGVFSKSQFDAAKNRREAAQAGVDAQKARIEQLEFQLKDAEAAVKRAEIFAKASRERVNATKGSYLNAQDQLFKTIKKSPIDGVVSSLPVKEGEFVLANLSSSPLMLIADMKDVNVEVKVDETDIANVKIGQPAKVKVDALGETEIDGEVTEIGHSAVTRSGQTIASTANTSQEAKDFKVVIKLKADDKTLTRLRPGMSATATVTTDTRKSVLAIPLQALVIKDMNEEKGKESAKASAAGEPEKVAKEGEKKRNEQQGVFVVKDGKAEFVPVQTGITGETDIEVISGLNENDKIVTGPFRQLRTLKAGTAVKEETAKPKGQEKEGK